MEGSAPRQNQPASRPKRKEDQELESVVFYFLSGVSIATALVAAASRRPIYAVAALVGCFCAVAGLYGLLSATSLAAVQLLFCAGAVGVVFPLAIVLLDSGGEASSKSHRAGGLRWVGWVALFVGVIFFGLLVTAVLGTAGTPGPGDDAVRGSLLALGQLLLTEYLLPLVATIIVVITGSVGAVWMARR